MPSSQRWGVIEIHYFIYVLYVPLVGMYWLVVVTTVGSTK